MGKDFRNSENSEVKTKKLRHVQLKNMEVPHVANKYFEF